MKLNIWRVAAFFLLIALSVGFGFAFDAIATSIERSNHPRPSEWEAMIGETAEEYGIPEMIVWAIVCEGSNFASNATSSDGRIGLMQLSPTRFAEISETLFGKEEPDTRLLYDPETNLQYGTAWLSHLYEQYGIWDLTYAAYYVGTDTVNAWLSDSAYVDESGILKKIPDPDTETYVNHVKESVEIYRKLYYKP